ncbi:zona pellucida glycoprotein 3f, tandem duplicate 2 [Boleophthalmus pectinirostris]|uniref:zona pellucida glycoprotein 3f, tandem duplicate 2 n=1 Tax=Boleophthalmus pectinirostris TaxID=150288 RepID=UPI0024302E4D|nr:zona pellucida glycoprotein 3f, tandem duplicate 2 [Boleophthalmus pectinirostris]
MITVLHLGVIVAVLSATLAKEDIKVSCLKDSVSIAWRIQADLVPYVARIFLGNCKPSQFHVLPTGDGEVLFHYQFAECRFKKRMKGKYIIFENELAFRPQQRMKPAAFVFPIKCVTKRPDSWVPQFLNPGAGSSEARGGLVFHMALLNAELTGIAESNIIPLGSFMPIWAAVDQKSHQPLLLLMEECIAATTPKLYPDSQVYPLITNQGCLVESQVGNSVFLPRYHSSSIIVYLQSFRFGLGQELYIHCKLIAWDPDHLDRTKKACYYSKKSGSWELLDSPEKSSICSCCASNCMTRSRRHIDIELEALSYHSIVGPVIIVDQSDRGVQDTKTGSTSTVV